jgi:hypothetical protein
MCRFQRATEAKATALGDEEVGERLRRIPNATWNKLYG